MDLCEKGFEGFGVVWGGEGGRDVVGRSECGWWDLGGIRCRK